MDDFSPKQIATLQTVVKSAVEQVVDDKLRINNEIIRQEIRAAKNEIITGIGEILDNHVLPQIDDHEVRLTRLETRPA